MFSEAYNKEKVMPLSVLGLDTNKSINSTFINTLFGTFTSQDTVFYNKHIIPQSKSSVRMRLVNNQTILINSTFGTSFPERTQNFRNKSFSSYDDDLQLTEFYKHFDMWKVEMRTLTTAVLFARLGQIHPEILPPNELMEALTTLKKTFVGKTLPFQPDIQNYDDIMNIMDLRVSVINEKLIFDLTIPLLSNEDYAKPSTIYKIVPFPIKLKAKDLYFFIQPRVDYVAYRNNDSSHIFLYEKYFRKCKEARDFKLCPGNYPVKELEDSCENSLINEKKDVFPICTIKLIKSQQRIWYKVEGNFWIFSTSEDSINVTCPENLKHVLNLRNSGWLTMNEPCLGATDILLLKPHSNFLKLFQDVEAYVQNLNVSLDEIFIDEFGNSSLIEPGSLKLQGTSLSQVKIQVNSIKMDLLQRKIQDQQEEEINIQTKNLANLKDENDHQMKEIEILNKEITMQARNLDDIKNNTRLDDQRFVEVIKQIAEQSKNAEDLRNYQFWIWVCICILTVLLILNIMKVFQKLEDCLRRKCTSRRFQMKNSGIKNAHDADYAEEEYVLKETSFPS